MVLSTTVDVFVPVVAGWNATLIEHVEPTPRLVPQSVVIGKDAACNPLTVIELIASATFPVLNTVTVCGALSVLMV